MHPLLNWRYYVMGAIFLAGFLSIACAFGEPERPMSGTELFLNTVLLLAAGLSCFCILGKLIRRWERDGKIS